jgi:hypothetical protein
MDLDFINSIFRIFFSVFFSFKLYYTLKAINLSFLERDIVFGKICFSILFFLNLLLFIGFYASIVAVAIFFIQRIIYYKILMYTLEDVYFHTATIFLIFADISSYFSINNFQIFNYDQLIPYYALTIGVGATFFSASIAKFNDKIWHNGKAIYYFFNLPYRRRFNFSKIGFFSNLKITKFLGKFQIFMQLILLPSCLFLQNEVAIFITVFNIIFCLVLVIFFHFLWLAELCLIMLLTILLGLIFIQTDIFFFEFIKNISNEINPNNLAKIFLIFTTATLIMQPTINFFNSKNLILRSTDKILFKINRIIFGVVPIKVFTAIHIENPLIFKIKYQSSKKNSKLVEVFNLYKDDGSINFKWIGLKPTLFSALTYKINDFLLEVEKNKISPERISLISGIFKYILKYEVSNNIKKDGKLIFFITQINTSKISKIEINKNLKFHKVIEVKYFKNDLKIKKLGKIFKIKTYRDINRENLIPSTKV